ncbi:unnamed protein product, partial [Rotaria sp. Silwood2]
GDEHVFVCQRLNNDTIQLQCFINPGGYSYPTIVTADSNYGGTFKVTWVALNNGMVYCEFTLSNFTTTMGRRRKRSISLLSQSTQYRILVATGHLAGSNYHQQAKRKLPQMIYDFYSTGSDDQLTLIDNQQAFRRIK